MFQKAVRGRPLHGEPQVRSQQASNLERRSAVMTMIIAIDTNALARCALRAAAFLGLALMLLSQPALARDPCEPGYDDPIPSCEHQVQAPLQFKAWQTSGWAFYCTGDHPYFYGMNQSYYDAFSWDNSCFTVTENELSDGVNKLDVTITNWCLKKEDITLTLACSATPPPGIAACTVTGSAVKDPGCPQSDINNYCSSSNPPVCIQTYTETCSNNVSYFCTRDVVFSYCLQCAPNSLSTPAKRASASGLLKALTAPARRASGGGYSPVQADEAGKE
jgi:hypothetical protein